jgi:hypothetical protein
MRLSYRDTAQLCNGEENHSKRLGVKLLVAPAGRPIPEKAQLPTDLATHVKSGETIKMDGYTMKPQ